MTSKAKGMKRSQPRRNWDEARAKVEREGACRVCGAMNRKLDAAHIIGRQHDQTLWVRPSGERMLYVKPDSIVPLCAVYMQPPYLAGCHADYDAHRIDLLGKLTPEEEAQAVLDAGSLESARRRLAPSLYRQERETDAA